MALVPQWMRPLTTSDDWRTSPVPDARRGRIGVARRAAGSFAGLLADMLSNEETAARPDLLQGIDARAKVLCILVLIVTATLLHGLFVLAALYALCLTLAIISHIPARRLARVWLVVPLFSLAIMLPATLNLVTPGSALLTLHRANPFVAVTDAGLIVAGRFVLRTAVCVSLVLLLTATTRPDRLFRGLRALGVPKVFVMLLTMMERYLWVLARAAEEIHLAKMSRSITQGSLREEQAWVAAGMGSLFRRTRALGNEVHLAMISRGYTGEVYLLGDKRAPLLAKEGLGEVR
jgi:cobalt/nickel transport system permease protein